jgi:hypothetical protein
MADATLASEVGGYSGSLWDERDAWGRGSEEKWKLRERSKYRRDEEKNALVL